MIDGDYEELTGINSNSFVEATNQVIEAQLDLETPIERIVRWPLRDLDTLTGPLGAGGDIWLVASSSGGGKTTFVTSIVELWLNRGLRIYVMPLETRPKVFRTHLACVRLGIFPGDALSKRLLFMEGGQARRQQIMEELQTQLRPPFSDQVMIDEARAIDVDGLRRGLKKAKAFEADVVIIDHIDHIAGGDGSNLVAESRRVNHEALRMAQDNELLLVLTSQLNMSIMGGSDRLAKYQPPQVNHLWLPGIKTQVATGIVGLFRRIREKLTDESQEEYMNKLKSARSGAIDPTEVLERAAMGTVAMKLRHYGQNEGKRAFLGFDRGRAIDLAEKDRYTTGNGQVRKQL
jgi:replicative DNA helicase